jgi:hypothetical protein
MLLRKMKSGFKYLNRQTQLPFVLNRIIPTDGRHWLVTLMPTSAVAWSAQRFPTAVNLGFLDHARDFFVQVAPQLSSQFWVDLVSDPLHLIKSGSAGNRPQDLRICSQELWLLDHRGSPPFQEIMHYFLTPHFVQELIKSEHCLCNSYTILDFRSRDWPVSRHPCKWTGRGRGASSGCIA